MFDFEAYKKELYRECKLVIPKMISDLSQSDIYAISLFNSGDSWMYIFPVALTEQGLEKVAREYKESKDYAEQSVDDLKAYLKWSPCDSPLHEEYVDALAETEGLLSIASTIMDDLFDEDETGEKCLQFENALAKETLSVLKTLIEEGVFRIGEREVLVNLFNGDQSDEERLERAHILNSEDLYDGYKSDLERCREIETKHFKLAYKAEH